MCAQQAVSAPAVLVVDDEPIVLQFRGRDRRLGSL
jgi:hypothetical protein